MADHTIMHVQYSNGVTIWQRVKASGEHFERSSVVYTNVNKCA